MSYDLKIIEGKELTDIKIVVSAVIVNGDGKILLIKRGETPKRGYYSFPEGHLKIGESLLDGVVRECLEEIDCKVKPLNDEILMLEGPSNTFLPDDYLEKAWPPSQGKIGLHTYKVLDSLPKSIEEPRESHHKKYFYIPCKLLGKPKPTQAALDIIYMTPREALNLKSKGDLKLMPTTSIVLALLNIGEFKIKQLR